jgi:SAM-dependent methyltransferase
MDLRPEGLQATKEDRPQAMLVQAEASHVPLRSGILEAVIMLDLMEHVDDRSLLMEVGRLLRPRGWLVLSVPAIQGIWSYRDDAANHLRRYSRSDLVRQLEKAGLELVEMRYYQFFLLPVLLVSRLVGRTWKGMREVEELRVPVLNGLLTWLNEAEVCLGDFVPWPMGSSLMAVCRRSDG